jgi:hypothetical protein
VFISLICYFFVIIFFKFDQFDDFSLANDAFFVDEQSPTVVKTQSLTTSNSRTSQQPQLPAQQQQQQQQQASRDVNSINRTLLQMGLRQLPMPNDAGQLDAAQTIACFYDLLAQMQNRSSSLNDELENVSLSW